MRLSKGLFPAPLMDNHMLIHRDAETMLITLIADNRFGSEKTAFFSTGCPVRFTAEKAGESLPVAKPAIRDESTAGSLLEELSVAEGAEALGSGKKEVARL